MKEKLIDDAVCFIKELFRNDSGGHDAAHTLRVYRNAMMIAEKEDGCDREIVALGSLLHDADDHKLFHTENNANARGFLKEHGIDEKKTEEIIIAINSVSFSQNRGRKPETLEGMIIQDADRLDAVGAVGIARAFAFGGEHGRSLDSTIDHFHEKLLLLKDEMNTETARRIAEKRHAYMLEFLKEYAAETTGEGTE